MSKKISLHDHRLEWVSNDIQDNNVYVKCSCGTIFEHDYNDKDTALPLGNLIREFNNHQKEMLNMQLKDINADIKVV